QKQNHLAPPAYALQEIIASRCNLNALVSDIAAEKIWKGHNLTQHYQQVLQQFQLLKQEAYFLLEQSVEHTSLAGFSVAVAYSNPLLYMKLAPQRLKERLSDDCIFVLYEGKSNVFVQASPKIGKRILDFVTSNGGGGRGHGGGFMLDHSVAPETYPQDKEDVLRRFAAYFSK
ncbi:hypothetical protein HYZ76_00110, partial [Candidatus Falkowbacteria bacterium]|nr:hypothetical protein [Candidatus Falkowbacteria bacterium]